MTTQWKRWRTSAAHTSRSGSLRWKFAGDDGEDWPIDLILCRTGQSTLTQTHTLWALKSRLQPKCIHIVYDASTHALYLRFLYHIIVKMMQWIANTDNTTYAYFDIVNVYTSYLFSSYIHADIFTHKKCCIYIYI